MLQALMVCLGGYKIGMTSYVTEVVSTNLTMKCDYIINNITEVFNNWIKYYKGLPICELPDKIKVMVMKLFLGRNESERDAQWKDTFLYPKYIEGEN
jgi:hypothetical protein